VGKGDGGLGKGKATGTLLFDVENVRKSGSGTSIKKKITSGGTVGGREGVGTLKYAISGETDLNREKTTDEEGRDQYLEKRSLRSRDPGHRKRGQNRRQIQGALPPPGRSEGTTTRTSSAGAGS